MTKRKTSESQHIWDAHEWSTVSAHDETQDSGKTAEDLWEDGAEWPTENPIAVAGKETTVTTNEAPSAAAEVVMGEDTTKQTEPFDKKEDTSTVSESVEEDGVEGADASTDSLSDTVEASSAQSGSVTEASDVGEDSDVETSSDVGEDSDAEFVLDGVRNDEAWGKSDDVWGDTEWDPSEEGEESDDVEESSVAEEVKGESPSAVAASESDWTPLPQPGWVTSFEGRRGYTLVFLFALLIFSVLFGQRIGQVSNEPHYVLLADAFLKNRWFLDSAPVHPVTGVRMNNDWARMDVVKVTRLEGKPLPRAVTLRGLWLGRPQKVRRFATLKKKYILHAKDIRAQRRFHFVSFPPLPAYLMMGPMWLLSRLGYDRQRFSDVTFSLFFAALAVLLLFWLLQSMSQSGRSRRTLYENLQLTVLFAFGSVFFFSAVQGTVWYTALIVGTCCSLSFLIATEYDKPLLAGVFVALGFLARPLLVLLSLFYFWQVIRKKEGWQSPFTAINLRKLVLFALPVALSIFGMMMFNQMRFGSPMEFGHSYLPAVFGRVEKYVLFHWHWIPRNFYAFFLATPEFFNVGKAMAANQMIGGSSFLSGKLSLTRFVPVWTTILFALSLFLAYRQHSRQEQEGEQDRLFWAVGLTLLAIVIVPFAMRWVPFPKINAHGLSLFLTTPALLILFASLFDLSKKREPWFWGLLGTTLIIIVPLLMYQNTGWLTFGNRFSLDYMPLLIVALAISGIVFGRMWKFLLVVAVVINMFGAITFGRAWSLYHHDIRSLDWIYSIDWINRLFS